MYEFSLDCVLGFLLFSIVCPYPPKLFLRMYVGSFGMLCTSFVFTLSNLQSPARHENKRKRGKKRREEMVTGSNLLCQEHLLHSLNLDLPKRLSKGDELPAKRLHDIFHGFLASVLFILWHFQIEFSGCVYEPVPSQTLEQLASPPVCGLNVFGHEVERASVPVADCWLEQ